MGIREPSPLVVRGLEAVLLLTLHFVASVSFSWQAYRVYDAHWTHADPAFTVPGWGSLPFFLPVFAGLGAASATWNRRGTLLSSLPVIPAFFFWLGGARACEYAQLTLWDVIGRPPLPAVVVGIGSAVVAGIGWGIGRRLLRGRRALPTPGPQPQPPSE